MKSVKSKPPSAGSRTSDARAILDDIFPPTEESLKRRQEIRTNMEVAQKIYDLRKKAGLTQKQLAERIGTHQTVISSLEDADYDGHSLSMLVRIAEALDKRVEIRFLPRRKLQPA